MVFKKSGLGLTDLKILGGLGLATSLTHTYLSSICMKEYFSLPAHVTYFRNRLFNTDFIINEHYRYQGCVRSECIFEFFQINQPVALNSITIN